MYNPKKIEDLLQQRGLRNKQLLIHLGYNERSGLLQSVSGDIRVSKLEKIADFFGVPMDTFFDRDIKSGSQDERVTKGKADSVNIAYEREQSLRDLLKEKDRRIQLLEEMVEMLKSNS